MAIGLAVIAAVTGVASEASLIAQARQHDYRLWAQAVERVIAAEPRGSTVLLNSIPDPWPALLGRDLGVSVLQAPPAGIGTEALAAAIARAALVISSDDIVSLDVAGRVARSDEWRAAPVTTVGGYQLLVWRRR